MRPGILPHPLAVVQLVCSIRVVSLEVLDYLEPLLSAVAAVQAVEWVLFGVGEVVVAQPSSPAEGPLTDTADIGAFLTVLLHVGLQQEACLEALSTLLTDEGARLPMACFLVDPQSICTVCAVFTLLTAVRLSTCMLCHVVLQLVHPFALVATFWTQILPLVLVSPHVILQARGVCTGIAALLTAVRLLPGVNAGVPGDLLTVSGGVLAVGALVQPGATM